MNKVYKVIWSKAKQGYVVVSELVKSHSKTNAAKHIQIRTSIIFSIFSIMIGSGYIGISNVYAGQEQWGGSATGDWTYVIGGESKGNGKNVTVYGHYNYANGRHNTLIGNNNHASQKDSSMESGDEVTFATMLGNNNRVRATEGIAIGDNVHTGGEAAIGIGLYTRATGAHSVAIGSSADNWNVNNTAVQSLGDYSVAVGTASTSAGNHAIAFGYQNYAKRNNAISIGKGNNAYGENGIAIGMNTSSGNNDDDNVKDTIAVGNDSKATGNQSTALGKGSRAMGNNAVAIGFNAQANEEQGIALGMNTKTVANAVALGANAAATEANTVSVGTAGGTMSRLVNMANATDDHDAVAYNQLITNVQYKDGKIAFYKGKDGETATDLVKAAWSFDINGTALTTENKAPQDTTYTDGNIQINKTTLHGQNTYDVKLNNNLDLTEQGSITAGNTRLDNTGLVITDGPKVTKAGMDAGNQVISNVADGKISTDSKEAINGGQFYKIEKKSIKNEKDIANIKTGDFFDNTTITNVTNKLTDGGEIAKDNAHLVTGGTIYTEVRPTDGTYVKTTNTTASNLNALDTQTKTNTDAIAKNAASIDGIKTGDFFDQTTITNLTKKLTKGGAIIKDNAYLVTGGTIYAEVRPTDGTYVKTANTTAANLKALDKQIKGNTDAIANIQTGNFFDKTTVEKFTEKLDMGQIEAGNRGLVSGGKVYEKIGSLDANMRYNYIKATSNVSENLAHLDTAIASGGMLNNSTTVTKYIQKLSEGGKIEAGNTKLVTGGTVYEAIQSASFLDDEKIVNHFTNKLVSGANIEKDNTKLVTGGMVYQAVQEEAAAREEADIALAKGINDIGRQIGNIDKRIQKVGAGAAALAALHTQEFDPNDKWDFAVGYGHYKSANAGALGAFYKPNANTIVSAASTFGNGDPMVNVGVSLKIGASGAKGKVVVKRAEYDVLQQKISSQEKQLILQEEQIKELRNLIESIAAKK